MGGDIDLAEKGVGLLVPACKKIAYLDACELPLCTLQARARRQAYTQIPKGRTA